MIRLSDHKIKSNKLLFAYSSIDEMTGSVTVRSYLFLLSSDLLVLSGCCLSLSPPPPEPLGGSHASTIHHTACHLGNTVNTGTLCERREITALNTGRCFEHREFSYLDTSGILQQEYSDPQILPIPHFLWVINTGICCER